MTESIPDSRVCKSESRARQDTGDPSAHGRNRRAHPERRLPDRCLRCGRFVGWYPVGFYGDQWCAECYGVLHPKVGDYSVVLPGTVGR